MPELPEVETIKRGLAGRLRGKRIVALRFLFPPVLANATPARVSRRLRGKKILSLRRRAKYLAFCFPGDTSLVFHLGMTGALILGEPSPPDSHTRLVLTFSGGLQLRFQDMRKFGHVYLENGNSLKKRLALGPEPLSPHFSAARLRKMLSGRKALVKSLIMDQKFLAGLGNIYACEALFRAGISPRRQAGSLSQKEIVRLHRAIRTVLREAIRARGTSTRDFRDARGKPGGYQKKLRVYCRQGEKCLLCREKIERLILSGRSTFYCPRCQPLPRRGRTL